ncbi:hypothetical protein SAMN05421788_101924 [Filimonas lacunae]|uniref:PKD domain-containing protein n=1 Tax=Filimonas lacunae TaxID=477680 RepID=A0A173MQ35_9BACT|nr:hypothetical protein [Filimonas lacunae]BAV09491.1 PKD domain containing protein [Filimonas lacunae]SIS74118.1 hypothetical protein SAMN05421788_101924 [Filimonas lacunae]
MNWGLPKKIYLLAVCAGVVAVSCKKDKDETVGRSRYISKVYAYVPAPGQLINDSTWGIDKAPATLIGGISGTVSLGAYGGYIVFGFDHAVQNSDGADIAIYGNPLPPPATEWSEPGIVMVSRDVNSNGLPDDEWYELAGSEYTSDATIKHYTITYYNPKKRANVLWRDSRGKTDSVLVNIYHSQANYYPLFITGQDSVSFTGTLLRNTLVNTSGSYTNLSFTRGYADSWSSGDNYTTNKYNSFDISQAVNGNGASVSLTQIDFVKVYTGQNGAGNAVVGEVSTEILGAADLHIQ